MKKVLITGGAGFIGTELAHVLLSNNFKVTILDNFSKQIHGENYKDSYLYKKVSDVCEIIVGDIRNKEDIEKSIKDVDYIFHLASETGTGQSMYEIKQYTDVNIVGTSNLIEALMNKKHKVKKLILASSRSVYGEGLYECEQHGIVNPKNRSTRDMSVGDFEVKCPICNKNVTFLATNEECKLTPISYYAFTKMSQESMLITMAPILDIPYTIFRYQNVYGCGQSLNNPYTGILSIFSKLLLTNENVNIFEDGNESRDFVHVKDVATATAAALYCDMTDNEIINLGYGESISVLEVAKLLKKFYNSKSELVISGDFRKGDIKNNKADINKARNMFSYTPKMNFIQGLREFADWVIREYRYKEHEFESSGYNNSLKELSENGLLIIGKQDGKSKDNN